MYIKNTLAFSLCSELSIMKEKVFESLFIKVHFKNKSIFCGTVYRPPRQDKNSIDSFNNSLHYVLNNINKTKNKYIISGDFNFNLLDSLDHHTDAFVQGDSAKCAQILFLVLCTCISSIINFQLLTFQFLII